MPLTSHLDQGPGLATLRLTGEITEDAELVSVVERVNAAKLVIDLSGVRRINSMGLREWIRFIRASTARGEVVLERCSPVMVRQFSTVLDSRKDATIVSVLLPYFCEVCDGEKTVLLDLAASPGSAIAERLPCPSCAKPMTFDDIAESYLAFLRP